MTVLILSRAISGTLCVAIVIILFFWEGRDNFIHKNLPILHVHYRIIKEPMALLEVDMAAGERITAESGAMVYIKGDVEIKTKTREGGLLAKLKVTALGGESFFVNEFVAKGDCTIGLTGPPIGDIVRIDVSQGNGYIVQAGSYIASTQGVLIDTQWQGFTKGLFGSEFFMLKVTGQGELFANAYGGIIKKDLAAGERMTVDNYHLVALSEQARYHVIKVGGMKTTILGGEGLATEVTGPGSVYLQTKNLREFVDLLGLSQRTETTTSGGPGMHFGGFRIG